MGKIVISQNVTLDGVVQDPTGEGGFRHGGWFLQVADKDREEWAKVELEEAMAAGALLLGRRTYEYFAAGWSERPGEWADRLRSLPKFVVSSTPLTGPDWLHASVVEGDKVKEISRLKEEVDGDIVVYGSRQLVRTLMDHTLADEVRLTVYPIVIGSGERLFDDLADSTRLHLLESTSIGSGLGFMSFKVVNDA